MLNQSGITKTTGAAPVQILANLQLQYSVGVVVSNSGVSADSTGKKIIKAGTPMTGNLDARTSAFTIASTTAGVDVEADLNGWTKTGSEYSKTFSVVAGNHTITGETIAEADIDEADGSLEITLPVAAIDNVDVSNAVGVLLHDVDVTNGDANATLLIFGFVNTNRLTTATKALIDNSVKAALKGKITFIAC